MKSKLSKLIEKDGFYIILFICVCVVAITAVLVSKENLNRRNEDKLSELEDFIIVEEEKEPSLEIAQIEETNEIEEIIEKDEQREDIETMLEQIDEVETVLEDTEKMEEDLEFVTEDIDKVNSEGNQKMILPVEGKLGTDFTTNNLIYSETLEEWTSHNGIDILAKEGTEVKAVLSGKVTEVYKDDLWGIVILVDHGNGLMTKYSNLNTGEMIKEGITVNKGDIISKVGKTATIEMMMEPHIHFEVIKDGINMDPKNYLPSLNH